MKIVGQTDNSRPQLSCVLEFTKAQKDNVTLTTSGDDSVEVAETFAAVEEQVERTFSAQWAPLLAILGGVLIAIFGVMSLQDYDPWPLVRSGLGRADVLELDRLSEHVEGAEAQTKFIYEVHRREIQRIANQLRPVELKNPLTLPNVLNGVLVATLAVLLVYLGIGCYPRNVFAWGDAGAHYDVLKERRKTIRNVLLFVIVGGVIVNLVQRAYGNVID